MPDIVNTIAATGTKITDAHVKFLGNEFAECSFEVDIVTLEHLKDLIRRILKVENVVRVYLDN